MFHDYYYAHSFSVMYREESSAVSRASNIVKCAELFDTNCQSFDPGPLKTGIKLEDILTLCEGLKPVYI